MEATKKIVLGVVKAAFAIAKAGFSGNPMSIVNAVIGQGDGLMGAFKYDKCKTE